MTFTLRATTPADIPDAASADARLRGLREAAAPLQDHRSRPARRAVRRRNPLIDSILAEAEARTVGFALWYFQFGTFSGRYGLFVEDIYVEPAYRGRGIGLALFRHMARVAVARDCIDMEWNVLDWNTPAIEFYRRIGAKPIRGWIPQSAQRATP